MKILSPKQIKKLDAHTIEQEPIKSIDLMERASKVFCQWFMSQFPNSDTPLFIFCGVGNNGGDGLAIARLLHKQFYKVEVYQLKVSKKITDEYKLNLKRLNSIKDIKIHSIKNDDQFPILPEKGIIVDAIFGSGLNRAVTGYWAKLIEHLNRKELPTVAVDIPSGLFADQHSAGNLILADYTFSFEFPKLAFLLPENQDAVGHWAYSSIQLSQSFIENIACVNHYIDHTFVKSIQVKKREKFSHKGTFGHCLIIGGKYGSVGAITLATKAALRSGVGLVTVHAPACANIILQTSAPEAMVSIDSDSSVVSKIPNATKFNAVGMGCGMGRNMNTRPALYFFLAKYKKPLVLDADALNIISLDEKYLKHVPKRSILTPHPKEFERLFGETNNHFERLNLLRQKAIEHEIYIILKGAHTCIATPEGECYFNSTGNAGMASGGSGDVLTGLLTGLLAQGYSPFETCVLGIYLHGLAGDVAAKKMGQEAMIAGDIIDSFGEAFRLLGTSSGDGVMG